MEEQEGFGRAAKGEIQLASWLAWKKVIVRV